MTVAFPIPAKILAKTLDELLSHLGETQVADLVRQADANVALTYSDSLSDTDYYTMTLRVPVAVFAAIDSRREEIEQLLLQKVGVILRGTEGALVNKVAIVPDVDITQAPSSSLFPPEILERIWEKGGLHLFLTHRADHKVVATHLKNQLAPFGVSAFVAHVDIEPNQEWQDEIKQALSSMHALAVLSTPGISLSAWCQQEIGFALGSGIPIFPIRLGEDPAGFISTIQALSGDARKPVELAGNLLDLLIKHARTAFQISESLLREFESVDSWEDARLLNSKIVTVKGFDEGQLARLEQTLVTNKKVAEAWGVPKAIGELIASQRKAFSTK